MNNLEIITKILQKDKRLWSDDKEPQLLKAELISLVSQDDEKLIDLLVSENKIKDQFFKQVGKAIIFKKEKFLQLVTMNEFLPDSFTSFENKIGIQVNGSLLSKSDSVSLVFPHKDCVLEGGQTKEESRRNEMFFNTILAPDEVDRLKEPKVFTNAVRIDKTGERKVSEIDEKDNLIIKGNNLLALYSLLPKYRGKIKLIYIDPPYNTGGDGFNYNDNFNHSSWLTFMKNRLEVSRELLSSDGSIFINIDDDESHYLKVLGDDVFGRDNFVTNIIWEKKYSPQNDAKYFSDMHDHILVFAKDKKSFKVNLIPRTVEANERYKNPDNDSRGPWKSSDFSVKTYSAKYDYEIITPSGRKVNPPKSRCWRTSMEKYKELVKDNRIYFGVDGNAVPSIKRFLSEVQDGTPPQTIWSYKEVSHNQDARKEITAILDDSDFSTPKPEKLIQRIVHIATNEGDLVLDYFLGSGTTTAVAHKMNRQYIGIEQMNYIEDVTLHRLRKVIDGEQGGISKNINWKGGGDFVYIEMLEWNQKYINLLEKAKNKKDMLSVKEKIEKEAFYKYQINFDDFDLKEFDLLSPEDQKQVLCDVLDLNHLYVNLGSIEDTTFKVSDEDKKFNGMFYNKK